MSLTNFAATLKQKDVPVPSMGEGATIIVTEKTIANVIRLQDLFKLIDDEGIKCTETLVAAMLICTMKKPDGSYLLPNDDIDTINLVAYKTDNDTTNALYDAYTELNPSPEVKESKPGEPKESALAAKKKKS